MEIRKKTALCAMRYFLAGTVAARPRQATPEKAAGSQLHLFFLNEIFKMYAGTVGQANLRKTKGDRK